MTKAKAITNDIVQNHDTQRVIFRVLVGSLLALSIVYVYLIGSITFNVLARKSLDNTVRQVGSHISTLELTYLAKANEIDKNYAASLGFVETNANIFAMRAGAARVAIR
jgi:hypothetical protein